MLRDLVLEVTRRTAARATAALTCGTAATTASTVRRIAHSPSPARPGGAAAACAGSTSLTRPTARLA
jgi:hypothetical protein